MGWQDKMKQWGGGDVSFLSEDGECITFCVIADPVLIKGTFQKQETQRIGAPVVTADGFTLLTIGKRVARRLAKYEKHFKEWAFDLIRHGEPGDTRSKYELKRCDFPDIEKACLAKAKAGVPQEDIDEAIKAASEIASG